MARLARFARQLAKEIMRTDEEQLRLAGNTRSVSATVSSIVARVLAYSTGAVLLVVAFMFSVVLFAIVAAAGLLGLGFLWWKTRELRRQLRERPPGGHVIEGVSIRDAAAVDDAQRRAIQSR